MAPAALLPSSFSTSRLSARTWLALGAGVGCAVCAYAGLYPRFDAGELRLVLALTSAPFGAAVVAVALGMRSAARAFGVTLLLAVLLGVASTILPAALLTLPRGGSDFLAGCVFGLLFGAPTGLLYGLPLAILAALGHRHVQAATHDATDGAVRLAGSWLFFVALLGLLGTQTLDGPRTVYGAGEAVEVAASPVPSIVAILGALGGVILLARATRRLQDRATWLSRVRAGLEPTFRLRPLDARDSVSDLSRVAEGTTVVEWRPDVAASDGSAYRVAASGVALALVE